MRNLVFINICILFLCLSEKSQAQDNWQIGMGASIVRLAEANTGSINEKHMFQAPRLNITKRIDDRWSFDGAVSFNAIEITEIAENNFNYFSVDASLRYAIYDKPKVLDPYAFGGLSIVTIELETTPTLNLGFGNTFWIFENFGLNVQAMYKMFDKETSHFQFTGGLVYKLSPGGRATWEMNR